jgi:hypothetical protein
MQTPFGRLSWNRVISTFRRRRPTSPIRRRANGTPRGLELIRLDDRIAPGSVLATAAAQAVMLSGPLAWLGLDEAEFRAAPAPTIPESSASANGNTGDASLSDPATNLFTFTAQDDASAGRSASVIDTIDSDTIGRVVLTDLGQPESQGPAGLGNPGSAQQNNFTSSTGAGGQSGVVALETGIRSGGFAVSGMPAKPTTDTSTPNSPSPLRGGGGGRGSATAVPTSKMSNSTPAPSPKPMSMPAGHFAAQLQTLLHSGDTSGAFNLADTANQQSKVGALIGGQLANAAGLGAGTSTDHRPASLLGQALADGSSKNLGLRTNPSSSGMFGLVGSNSIDDLVNGPTAHGGSSSLTTGAGAIANAIPTDGSPLLPGPAGHAFQPPAPAVGAGSAGLVVVSPLSRTPPGAAPKGKRNGPARQDPGQLPDATFTLTIPDSGYQFVETGSFSMSGWGTWLDVHVHGWITNGEDRGEDEWGEYSYPADGVYGFDLAGLEVFNANLDAFNSQSGNFYEFVNNSDPGYTLTLTATTPFGITDTSTPTESSGTVTTNTQNNFTTTGTDAFTVTFTGPMGTGRGMVRDDTVNATFGGSDTGIDSDSANPAVTSVTNDSFTDNVSNGTATETDHVEGTVAADGTFQLTSFNIDSTSDEDFTDSVTGTTQAPEPGGSESDTFTDGDSGHDHEHLTASGTPDNWTASFDNNANESFSDVDNGSESSSTQTGTGATATTDTNHDGFHADDGGTYTDALHLAGTGNATAFTANAVNDRIEDTSNFHDGDTNNPADTTTTATDSSTDHYHYSDNGNSDEVLTIGGDANNLTAGYTDGAHDAFTDSNVIDDNWSGTDANGGNDAGTDHSTNGDNGNETVNLSANAGLSNWQADSTASPAPTWEVTSVGADITGTAGVNAGDDGTDTDVSAANSADSDHEHYVDTSTGTDNFQFHLTGNGTTATLLPTVTYGMTTHSEDDNTSLWNDPEVIPGQVGADSGSDEVDAIGDDTGTVTVSETESLAADGTATVTSASVDLTDVGTAQETDVGTDDISLVPAGAPVGTPAVLGGINNQENINDSATLGENIHIHTTPAAGRTTSVDVEQKLNGPITLGGGENDSNTENPADTDTDVATGTLGGPIDGDIHQTGTVTDSPDGPQEALSPANGSLDANLTGNATGKKIEVFSSDAAAIPAQYIPSTFSVNDLSRLEPAVAIPSSSFDQADPEPITVTVTTTTTVPNILANDDVNDTAGTWTLDSLDFGSKQTIAKTYAGHYPDGQLLGGSGDGGGTTSDTIIEAESGSPRNMTGSETTIHTESISADATINGPNDANGDPTTIGEVHLHGSKTSTETANGTDDAGGAADAVVNESRHETGWVDYVLHVEIPALTEDYTRNATHAYDDTGRDTAGGNVLLTATGTDTLDVTLTVVRTSADSVENFNDSFHATQTTTKKDGGDIEKTSTPTDTLTHTITNVATGVTTPVTTGNPPPPSPWDTILGWAAKAADFAQEITQVVGNAAVSAAKWVGSAAYAVAHKAVQPFLMGYDLLQCGYVGIYGAITGDFFEPDWMSELAKNSPKDPNDKEAWGRYIVENELDNLKDGAIAIATLGVGKAVGPVVCKITKTGCFGPGMPVPVEFGCKAIKDIKKGDRVWMRPEHDPTAPPVLGRVAETFKTYAPVCELHVGGKVIRVTAEHTFWVRGKGWTAACDLRPGMELRTEDAWTKCERFVDTGESEFVYNFEVAEGHTYFVGDPATWGFSLWNHNAIDCASAAAKATNLNANNAVSRFGVYELRANGVLHKVGKADLNRITKSSGLPTRVHQQVEKLKGIYGNDVTGKVVQELGDVTTKVAKAAETSHLQDIFDRLKIVPAGNLRSFFPN